MKVVINRCFGGFGLSHEAVVRYAQLKGLDLTVVEKESKHFGEFDYYLGAVEDENYWYEGMIARDDPALVRTVEELGEKAESKFSTLKVVDIPDDVEWTIHEYDGNEWVAEVHRTWS